MGNIGWVISLKRIHDEKEHPHSWEVMDWPEERLQNYCYSKSMILISSLQDAISIKQKKRMQLFKEKCDPMNEFDQPII